MIFLTILLFIAIFVAIVHEIIFMLEYGTPPKDKDVLEMWEKCKDSYNELDQTYIDQFRLDTKQWGITPKIIKFNYSLLWFGHIKEVGVLPRWYKSSKIIKQRFNEEIKKSKYTVTKRDKLGL
tara:strand:- start:321 stop:689 length:369 start_codon:yes stop_codon:yes gene_type:complete